MMLFRSTTNERRIPWGFPHKFAKPRKQFQNKKKLTNLSIGSELQCTFRSQHKGLPRKRRCARPTSRIYDDYTCNRHVCENVTQWNDFTAIFKLLGIISWESDGHDNIARTRIAIFQYRFDKIIHMNVDIARIWLQSRSTIYILYNDTI